MWLFSGCYSSKNAATFSLGEMWFSLALLMHFVGVANGLIVFRVMTIDPQLSPSGCFNAKLLMSCSSSSLKMNIIIFFYFVVSDIEWPLHWVLE